MTLNKAGGSPESGAPISPPLFPYVQRVVVTKKEISHGKWKNGLINDLSAKGAVFNDCDFSYAEIDLGYFHQAQFKNCLFIGTKFSNCNFKSAHFYNCDFSYSSFTHCVVEIKEILSALPSAPNIRRDALQSLKSNAIEMADFENISVLTLQEIDATIRHYSYALRGTDTYYRSKYAGIFSKIGAGYKLFTLISAGIVWGHGERPWRLLTSCIVVLSLLGLINIWSVLPHVTWHEIANATHVFEYVFRLFLDMTVDAKFAGFPLIDYAIVIMRYVYIGLFISILYKSISRR